MQKEDFTSEIKKANDLKDEGNKFFKSQQFEDAKNTYIQSRQLIQKYHIQSQCKDLLINLEANIAMTYLKLENYEQAIEYASFAIQKQPNNGKAFYRRGVAYRNLNNLENALKDLNFAFSITKDQTTLNEIKEIEAELAKNPVARAAMMYNEGKAKFEAKHYLKSKEEFDKALQLISSQKSSPEVDQLRKNIKKTYDLMIIELNYEQGNYMETIEKCDVVLQSNPSYFQAHYRKGYALDKVGYAKKAIIQLQEALKYAPNVEKEIELNKQIEYIKQQNE